MRLFFIKRRRCFAKEKEKKKTRPSFFSKRRRRRIIITLCPRACSFVSALGPQFSPAGQARGRREACWRGKRPFCGLERGVRGARRREKACFFFFAAETVSSSSKTLKIRAADFPLHFLFLAPTLFFSSLRRLFPPRATMSALAQRTSLRVGAPLSVSSKTTGCEEAARKGS